MQPHRCFFICFRETGIFSSQFCSRPSGAILIQLCCFSIQKSCLKSIFSPPQAKIFDISRVPEEFSFDFRIFFEKFWKFSRDGLEKNPSDGIFWKNSRFKRKKTCFKPQNLSESSNIFALSSKFSIGRKVREIACSKRHPAKWEAVILHGNLIWQLLEPPRIQCL